MVCSHSTGRLGLAASTSAQAEWFPSNAVAGGAPGNGLLRNLGGCSLPPPLARAPQGLTRRNRGGPGAKSAQTELGRHGVAANTHLKRTVQVLIRPDISHANDTQGGGGCKKSKGRLRFHVATIVNNTQAACERPLAQPKAARFFARLRTLRRDARNFFGIDQGDAGRVLPCPPWQDR